MIINTNTRGSIVFITSIHDSPISYAPSYGALKAALVRIVKKLAMEPAPHGIRVNGMAPGFVHEDEDENTVSCMNVPLHKRRNQIKKLFWGNMLNLLRS